MDATKQGRQEPWPRKGAVHMDSQNSACAPAKRTALRVIVRWLHEGSGMSNRGVVGRREVESCSQTAQHIGKG